MKRELEEYAAEKEELTHTNLEFSRKESEIANELQALKSTLKTVETAKVESDTEKEKLLLTLTLLDSTKSELMSVKTEKEKLSSDTENLNKQNKELLNRLESLECDLKQNKTNGQEAAKQEVSILTVWMKVC